MFERLICWWQGCDPHYEVVHFDTQLDGWSEVVPCKRCGASDTTYADRVGDTRKHRVTEWLRYWLWARWQPVRCRECGHQGSKRCDCVPF